MSYFQLINECLTRESESGVHIEHMRGLEGHVLRRLSKNSVKTLSISFKYDILQGENVKFVLGALPQKERLIEIPLSKDKSEINLKINLKNKTITGDVQRVITENIRSIMWVGLLLEDSAVKISYPNLDFIEESPIKKSPEKRGVSLVCLLTRNSEHQIKEKLVEIEKKFKGSSWSLIVADVDSQDSTYDLIQLHDSSAKIFHYFQFAAGLKTKDAFERLKEFAKSFERSHDTMIFEECVSKKNRHTIQSFCTVATDNLKIEASILIKSLREHHQEPIYIICDLETKKFLEIEGFDNLKFKTSLSQESLLKIKNEIFHNKFTSINKYHKPECILNKMHVMEYALQENDNTFFLDADVVVLDSLQENFHKDIVLSPHYHLPNKISQSLEYGFFNAGYIFCADKSFPDYWKEIFLNRSTFFEQEGMNHIIEDYDIQFFSQGHNLGFWRKGKVPEKVKSFHVHLIEKEFAGEKVLQDANYDTRKKLFAYLNKIENTSLKKYIINCEGKSWGGMDTNSYAKSSNPKGKINLKNQQVFWHHRSGWNYAMQALSPLNNDNGILFDGFLEKNFSWHLNKNVENNILPYTQPWVGFFHNPPDIPEWFFYENSVQEIIKNPTVQESLNYCLGLFALSEYHATHLRKLVGKPVSALMHPTSIPNIRFSFTEYLKNQDRKIVNIGYWLRKLNSIFSLPLSKSDNFTKIRLMPYSDSAPKSMINKLLEKEKRVLHIEDTIYKDNTLTLERIPDEEYDLLLSKNIAFLDLYDSSANNAIIECIARATPILVNPIAAVVEYLGEEYPFYFNSLEEAAVKAKDENLVKETHQYLLSCSTRGKLSQDYFKKSMEESEVYNLL